MEFVNTSVDPRIAKDTYSRMIDKLIEKFIAGIEKSGRTIVIWGSGKSGRLFYEILHAHTLKP